MSNKVIINSNGPENDLLTDISTKNNKIVPPPLPTMKQPKYNSKVAGNLSVNLPDVMVGRKSMPDIKPNLPDANDGVTIITQQKQAYNNIVDKQLNSVHPNLEKPHKIEYKYPEIIDNIDLTVSTIKEGTVDHYNNKSKYNLTPSTFLNKADLIKDSVQVNKVYSNTYNTKTKNIKPMYVNVIKQENYDNRPKFSNNKMNIYTQYGPHTGLYIKKATGDLPEPSHIQTNELI